MRAGEGASKADVSGRGRGRRRGRKGGRTSAGQRYVEMMETLRDQLAREKEAACGRERELARQT